MLRMHVRRPTRLWRTLNHPVVPYVLVIVVVLALWSSRHVLYALYTLLAMPLKWNHGSSRFLISSAPVSAGGDGFDLTFANYSTDQDTAGPGYEDRVPPVLHHIQLGVPKHASGGGRGSEEWQGARRSCLDAHPGWEAHMWTEETATKFVREKYPDMYDMWMNYRYPIERIDALRYLVLYEYGGVILDMDLRCKRSLGPLRRFEFVAPAAHPVGISNGFMMSAKRSKFMADIIESLGKYNKYWFWLPYPTVMFSTGCHFASTIHTLQPNRYDLKVLAGPPDNYRLHSLNGLVSTPLFDHLGSSSWHSFDAAVIVWLGRLSRWNLAMLVGVGLCVVVFLLRSHLRGRLRRSGLEPYSLGWRQKIRMMGKNPEEITLVERSSGEDFV